MEYLTNDSALTNMANAIRTKTGSSSLITYDETLGFKTAIDAIPTGGGSTPVPALSKGVNFIDYDGTVVEAWQTSEVAGKSALPSNPSHDGLTAQGWNWSLANIKSYIADYPDAVVWVGQMYITDDGKTRVYIHLEEGRLSPYLGLAVNGSVDIDWGDNSTHGTLTGTSITTVKNVQHTYASGGDYVIVLTVTGTVSIIGSSSYGSQLFYKSRTPGTLNRVYQNSIQKVEIGSNIVIGDYAFNCCYSLASVTMPNSVTSIGSNAFNDCLSLVSVTMPNSVTSIGNNAFGYCYSLASVTIPDSVTSVGSSAFGYCYSLASVIIPDSVTSIDNSVFSTCYPLTSITIPDSVTSIGNNAFNYCYSLVSITIPDDVTSIGSSAFNSCYGLGFIKFTSTTPPTVANSNAWSSIPTDCIIYVPTGTLETYKTATNYPNPTNYTYREY